MDGSRFDSLARTLAISRRGALRALAGGAIIGLARLAGAEGVAAQDRLLRKPRGFERLGKPCNNDELCGIHTPCDGKYCAPVKCWIGGQVVDYWTHNPDRICQWCFPPEAWNAWSDAPEGKSCDPVNTGNPCTDDLFGSCQGGECVPRTLGDHYDCGPDQVCCQGECCAAGLICNPDTGCGGCYIEEVSYPAGINSGNPCLTCDAAANPSGWTPSPGNPPCGDDLDRVCCNGECCPPDKCCSPAGLCEECCGPENGLANLGEGSCELGCTIDGLVYAAGETNPAQECQICDPDVNPSAWTSRADNEICGPNGDRACCAGACCTDRGCCLPTDVGGRCDIEFCGGGDPCAGLDPCGCTIDGAFYEPDARNPANECESCNISVSTSAWSPKTLGSCGPNGDRFCDRGVCCDLGICPNVTLDACAEYCDAVCVIGGILYYQGDRHPANSCLQCAPSASHTDWSYMPSNYYCDPVAQTGACCFGTCCGAGSWCNDFGICEAFAS